MDKLIVLGMGIPYPYPTHGHPYLGIFSTWFNLYFGLLAVKVYLLLSVEVVIG